MQRHSDGGVVNYSKTHQNFSNRLQKLEALTNPQDFLGPNYETVLNFWWFLDSLTEDQRNEVNRRYSALDYAAWNAAWSAARGAAGVVAGVAAWDAARGAAWDATYELIGMHTLLNAGKDLMFVPLFNDL